MAQYDFTNYYRQAYWDIKEKNVSLACDTASKEQAVLELRQKYERIAGNPVIRLLRGVKKIPAKLADKKADYAQESPCPEQSMSVKQYEKEVLLQKNPYMGWIMQHESELRIKEAENTKIVKYNECNGKFTLANIKETYVIFCSERGRMSDNTQAIVEQYFEAHPETEILYGAEDEWNMEKQEGDMRENPWFKPVFSPETLLSFFYFGSLFAIRREAFETIKWLGSDNGKVNVYDFVLKATEKMDAQKVAALDAVLFHREKNTKGVWGFEKEFSKMKTDIMRSRGYNAYAEETNVPGVYSIRVECDDKISIVILSKDNPELLSRCISSIREKTDYDNYEIIVVDNGSHEANRVKVEALSQKMAFIYICEPMDFNFSKMCNIGANHAKGKYLLLLNDDVEVIEAGWLRRMAGQASVEGVGAVGAKLWYPDSIAIQHAGITNLRIGPAHKLVTSKDDKMYYDGRNYFNFNCLAVTGACLMVKKELYEEVGGLDPSMPIAYNDVEFCFALHKKGYRNVLRNDCILLHHESLSRGLDEETKEKADRLLAERKRLYEKYPRYEGWDGYYSPYLVQDSPLYECGVTKANVSVTKPIAPFQNKSKAKLLSDKAICSNVESVLLENNVLKMRGWSILKNADNCHYKKRFFLRGLRNKNVYVAETQRCLREDVAKVFDTQVRIELSGMETEAMVKTIPEDLYEIGVVYEDMLSDNAYYCMTKNTIEIK